MTTPWSAVESRLDALVATPVADERSARDALSELMSTVAQINQATSGLSARDAAADDLVDDLAGRRKDWIDRLIDKLTEIVEKIARATSFTITVGSEVSVSVTFGPFGA